MAARWVRRSSWSLYIKGLQAAVSWERFLLVMKNVAAFPAFPPLRIPSVFLGVQRSLLGFISWGLLLYAYRKDY